LKQNAEYVAFRLRKLAHCLVTAVKLYLAHFWLRYAKQLSQLKSISLLTAVKDGKRFCFTLGNYRCAH